MLTKISTLMALYFYLNAYSVDATIRSVNQEKIIRDFFSPRYIKADENHRIINLIGDIRSVKKGTLDQTCKQLQIRRLRKSYPLVLANEENTVFGDFETPPGALGIDSMKVYDQREPSENWEIGEYEYLLMRVHGTTYKKEIYHVPPVRCYDIYGRVYSTRDGYFALDDINEKGRPLIFDVTRESTAAVLVAYEDTLHFSFPGRPDA